MTQEDKSLLLKDLCARLPYGVMIHIEETNEIEELYCLNIPQEGLYTRNKEHHDISSLCPIEQAKPYFRPMSSMTEEEIKTYHSYCEYNDGDFSGEILYFDTIESFDYLTSIHIDYRGLIPMGLALEAPDDMYGKI